MKNQDVKVLAKSYNNRIIAGVCAGIAEYFEVDALWVRLLFVLLIPAGGISIVAYLVLCCLMPRATKAVDVLAKRLYRSSTNRIIAGVCGGIAEYLGVDATWVRLIFILMAVGSLGVVGLMYLLLWVCLPSQKSVLA